MTNTRLIATVIGIGNVARGDDGAAHRVLEHLDDIRGTSGAALLQVQLVSAHQLDFGMAADIAAADLVIFIDAERRSEPLTSLERVSPGPGVASLHGVDPSGLLGLARSLYGATPEAWLVSVAAPSMQHAEGLSDIAEAASAEAASVVRALLAEHGGRLGNS